jgi:uncharacterized protein YjiS (DUF1127 family)
MLTIINSAHALNRLSIVLDDVRRAWGYGFAVVVLRKGMDTMVRWQERAGERRRLADMDDRTLADIGVSRSDARAEFDKPFWRV